MNYCIYLKKRKNKPYCTLLKSEIQLSNCNGCTSKEYKKCTIKSKNSALIEKKEYKKPTKSHKSKKRITVSKQTYNSVIQRDNYSCRLCGSTNWLELHHILYRSQRKDLINDINNCIMLCSNCHKLVHNNKKKWQPILVKMNFKD